MMSKCYENIEGESLVFRSAWNMGQCQGRPARGGWVWLKCGRWIGGHCSVGKSMNSPWIYDELKSEIIICMEKKWVKRDSFI